MTPSSIPSQLSQSVFRWCEPYITRAVHAWPQETVFTPAEMLDLKGNRLSPHTFIARMRDAVVSVKRFGWTPTTVDVVKLSAMAGTFVLAFTPDGSVTWRQKGQRGRPSGAVTAVPEEDQSSSVWNNPTDDEVRALALLLDSGRLQGPYTLGCTLSAETVMSLENEFNVAVMVDGMKRETIIT